MKTSFKGKRKPFLLFIFTFILAVPVFSQQQISLSGKVFDSKTNEPVVGSNIIIKGTSIGVITDADGSFRLEAKKTLPFTIEASILGYVTQEIDVYENEPLSISLAPGSNRLNEVVVIGYGTQKRKDVTGSVSSLSGATLKQIPVSSFEGSLQGSVSGVQVTQTSGQPGAAISIRIRGGNSITGGNEPLYVIDGFPIYNNNSDANAGVVQGPSISALASLNPGDIESMDILKDASATAIYGSRGANGVVIITTKKGKLGEGTVTYDASYGIQRVAKTLSVLNAQEWARLKNDAIENTNKYKNIPNGLPVTPPAFTEAQIEALGEGTDWQNEAFRDAPTQNHQLTYSGGDDRSHFSLSGGYLKQDGILLNTDFERYSVRLNADRKFSEKFKAGINFNASKSSSQVMGANGVYGGTIVTSLLFMPPTVPVKDEDGKYILKSPYESQVGNPIAYLKESVNRTNIYRVLGNFYNEYIITEGLTAKVTVGTDFLANKQNRYLPTSIYEGVLTNGSASVGTKFTTTWLNENTLNYSKTFNSRHSIDALIGFTQQQARSEATTTGSQQFVTDAFTYNNLGAGSVTVSPTSNTFEWGLISYLGRINYSFAQKYLFTASIRADGSSRFGKNNKWGYFPSGSFAWQINKEEFLKNLTYLNTFKLRLSAGVTGNQEIGQYQSLATLATYGYILGNQVLNGFSPSRVSNPDLSWETTNQYDGGIDIGLFEDRISFVFDAYYKKTTNLLLEVPLPYTSGYNTSLQNLGSIENKGIELSLNTENLKGQFTWNSNVVFSLNRNKVLSLGGKDSFFPSLLEVETPVIVKVGESLGSFYGYKTKGIFKSTDDIANLPRIDQAGTKPGDQRYEDISGADGKPDGVINQAYDRTIIGRAEPKFIYGFSNNFSYRNIDLNILLQGAYDFQLYNQTRQQLELTTGFQNGSKELNNRWTPTHEDAVIPRANENVPATPISDRFVEDASYLRLKGLTLGYTFPKKAVAKIKISNLRIYFTAQNLYTWTDYTGYDPEVSQREQNSVAQGFDYGSYPSAKTFLAGLSLTF